MATRSPAQRARDTLSAKRRADRNRVISLNYLLNNPCVVCGEDDPRCLTYDHLDESSKSVAVAHLVQRGSSVKTLMDEIAKCQVLCSNCHAKKNSDEYGFFTSNPEFLEKAADLDFSEAY